VPAGVQDRGDEVVAGEVAVEADDEAGEQLRPRPDQALQQGLLPGAGLAQDRLERRPPGPGGRLALRGVSFLLHRLGFSPQVPAHRAFERDEDAVAEWRSATWAKVRGKRR
jgi:Winged helix-turn helix